MNSQIVSVAFRAGYIQILRHYGRTEWKDVLIMRTRSTEVSDYMPKPPISQASINRLMRALVTKVNTEAHRLEFDDIGSPVLRFVWGVALEFDKEVF